MKNDVITLDITDLTFEGYGVGRQDGKVCFVSDAASGDRAEVLVLKELKNRSYAKIQRIITPSPDRIDSDCEVSQKCGGCVFRHVDYSAELSLKREHVRQCLARIGGLDIEVEETVFDTQYRYRNKVQYPFSVSENGKNRFGYYAKRSHRVIEHGSCMLQDEIFTEIASFCASTADGLGIAAYDENTARGALRHLVMRKNRKGEILVCIVSASDDKRIQTLADKIHGHFDEVIGVHLNINKRLDNVIFGDETRRLVGCDVLTDMLCGRTFELSIRAFYQVNAAMAEKLYDHARRLVDSSGGMIILDLYCGAGTIGLCVAERDDKLCGVEIIDAAVENAKRNAALNGRSDSDTMFVCGDASVGVEECRKRFGNPDVIIVDPPRKGLDPEVIQTIVSASPKKVVYISCDPATLARDCAIFAENGYTAEKATPFDLFPRTGHVETIVCLRKQ